jgi:hypothetical protein
MGERVSEQRRRAGERVTETERVRGDWRVGERVMRGGSRRLVAGLGKLENSNPKCCGVWFVKN